VECDQTRRTGNEGEVCLLLTGAFGIYVDRKNRPDQQTFCCKVCGFRAHADLNAAINIERRLHDTELRACKDRKAIKTLLLKRHEAWKQQSEHP
jgi:transposase